MADGANENVFTERTVGDWTAYQDDDGGTYYHNETTGESSWDAPPGFEDDAVESGPDGDGDGVDGGAVEDGDGVEGALGEVDDVARTPPLDERNYDIRSPAAADLDENNDGVTQSPPDDGFTQSPSNDGFTQSPSNDGFTQSPPGDGFTQSPSNDGITRSPSNDDFAQSPPDDGFTQSPSNDGITESPPHDGIAESPPPNEGAPAEEGGEEEENVAADGEDIGNGWVAYKDEEGRVYYYNADLEETQWDRPDVAGVGGEGPDAPGTATPPSPDSSPRSKSPPAGDGGDSPDGDGEETDAAGDGAPAGAEEEPEDAAAAAERFLRRPDAVMEHRVLDHINVLVRELGPQVAGPKAMGSLMNGYGGDTAVCGLMGLWLAELKAAGDAGGGGAAGKKGGSNGGTTTSVPRMGDASASSNRNAAANNDAQLFELGADAARDVVEEVVNRLAKERFTKDGGDAIVALSKKEAAFVDRMIRSGRWRKLLIDLSATTANKDSQLFMYCLQSISNLGHHRDIANRINQSDYFGVFSSMLQSELCVAARIAVDGHAREVADSMDTTRGGGPMMMGSLIADLRRTCTSTSYTYLYAMEVLKELLSRSKGMLSADGEGGGRRPEGASLERAVRKWERLREELEDEMLKPIKKGTTFQRKRRIDVALTMSDLFQRKRRRKDPRVGDANGRNGDDGDSGGASSKDDLADALDAALAQLLTKNSLGSQIDRETAEDMLKFAYGGSTDRIGDLLIRHPTAVVALLRNLFGSRRVRQAETRIKCARLVALAVTASERRAGSSRADCEDGEMPGDGSDEDALSQVVLNGSQLCEQLENKVSFAVVDDVESVTEGSSVGRRLSAMCVEHSVVAQGVLTWAKDLADKSDFVTTVSYPTISPCILSLARLICRHHPLTRPAVLDISLAFMGHSNREISHRKMQSIKEQCLRLLLWLMTQGMSLAVVSAVRGKLEGGSDGDSSEMDSALVRYFFSGILEVVGPPLSLAFVRALGGLMTRRPFVDALRSKHFEESKRGRIVRLVGQFEAAVAGDVQKTVSWEGDGALLSTLRSTYCVRNKRTIS